MKRCFALLAALAVAAALGAPFAALAHGPSHACGCAPDACVCSLTALRAGDHCRLGGKGLQVRSCPTPSQPDAEAPSALAKGALAAVAGPSTLVELGRAAERPPRPTWRERPAIDPPPPRPA
jgi:hypothetical protein